MFRKVSVIGLTVIVGGLGWMAWGAQQGDAGVDDHGASLIAACRDALDRCDVDAFLALIYTGETAEGRDTSGHRSMFKADCGRAVASITIDPLQPNDVTSYEMHGVHYRPTRPPEGKLVIRFASETGAAVHDEETTFLAGRADGRWWVLTAEPGR